ncbi:hypothetical protein imdm_1314 [gamma proteobacterium IMCC2047]|nr:hypothetical protein imdm_1314 [gamma proteobacterium IMCC2047]
MNRKLPNPLQGVGNTLQDGFFKIQPVSGKVGIGLKLI